MPERVVLRAPSGAEYAVTACWVGGPDGRNTTGQPASAPPPDSMRLEVVLDAADVPALDRDGLFNLAGAARPAGLVLDPAAPATLHLRPGRELLDTPPPWGGGAATPSAAGATGPPEPGDAVASWLAADPLRSRTDLWFAARVAQPAARPPVQATTLWHYADPPAADAAPDPADASRAVLDFLRAEHPQLVGQADALQHLLDLLHPAGVRAPADVPEALDRLATVLTGAGCEPTRLDDGTGLRFAIRGQFGSWPCLVQSAAGDALIFYAICPQVVPPGRLAEAYGAIGRFNSAQLLGSLDLDPDSGRAVQRLPLLLDSRTPSDELLRHALDATVDAMDAAWPLLAQLVADSGGAA